MTDFAPRLSHWFDQQAALPRAAQASDANGQSLPLATAMQACLALLTDAVAAGGRLFFIGNGGSAGIASHMAIDYAKNGRLRALALSDAAALTCLGNDFGYQAVFAHQLELQGRAGDVVIAISSSGRSANMIAAADVADQIGLHLVTLTGFDDDNPLRQRGMYNFHIASHAYGFVEISHLTLLHAMLDLHLGWGARQGADI